MSLLWATSDQAGRTRTEPPSQLRYPAGSLLVVGGPVGVGKSTFVQRIGLGDAELISVDELRRDEQERRGQRRGEYRPECWPQALLNFDRRLHAALGAGRSVVCDLTVVDRGPISNFVAAGRRHGRPVHAIYLDGDLALCMAGQVGRQTPIGEPTVREYVSAWQRIRAELAVHGVRRLGWTSAAVLDRAAAGQVHEILFD